VQKRDDQAWSGVSVFPSMSDPFPPMDRMHAANPHESAFLRNLEPVSKELSFDRLSVTGAIPPGLNGVLLRNGPNPCHPQERRHWFEGDGMLHMFAFANGAVSYRNRWLPTRRLLRQQAAGASAAPASGDFDDGVANTNVLVHAGRLLALEEAHLPLQLNSLEATSAASTSFGGRLAGPFTAHPKTDPVTGELVFFGYGTPERLGAGMSFGTIDAAGRVQRFDRFTAPYASMVHDFAITRHHALFPVMPLVADPHRAAAGGRPFAWEPARSSYVGLLRREADVATLSWRAAPRGFAFHVMNAWEDGSRIHLDLMHSAAPPLFSMADESAVTGDTDAYLSRWTFELNDPRSVATCEMLCHIPGEFPRIDERMTGRAHRHGWFVGDGTGGHPFARLVHVDHEDGRLDVLALPGTDCASEGVFVARAEDAVEGEGWLLSVIYRGQQHRSDLFVLDAQHLCDGPVAVVHLPCRVPNGFHGNWIGAASAGLAAQGPKPV